MRRAIQLAAVSMCACSGGGETAIDLAIRYDPALGLERFALTASSGGESLVERTLLPEDDRPLSESGREAVVVVVADDLGGDEVTLRVDGLARGDVIASGQVAVRVTAGELVAAEVTLRPSGGDDCEAWDWQPSNVVPCEDAAPDGPLVLDQPGVYTIDTETGRIATPDGDSLAPASDLVARAGAPMLRLLAVDSLEVAADTVLEATGPHALLIAVWGDASIAGTIDLSGEAGRHGPGGADPDLCTSAAGRVGGNAGNSDSGAGGGGGGGFGGPGGDGGDGHGDQKGGKGMKGMEAGNAALAPLVGGCPGGRGGDAAGDDGSGATGGGGGGALAIAARDSISLRGTIRVAGGAGGGGAAGGSGGGGVGSGGAILLQSVVIELSSNARVCANGGSGGEGGGTDEDGAAGSGGTCSEERATTSNLLDDGGDGGRGSGGDMLAGENGKAGGDKGAGGGGGGGAGRIRLRALGELTDLGALVTPEAG